MSNRVLESMMLVLLGAGIVASQGCSAGTAAGPANSAATFNLQVDSVLDDADTKIFILELSFNGEQRVGVFEGPHDKSYVTAGYGSEQNTNQSARVLVFAHQTEEKRNDEVIRRVSVSVVPRANGSRAGGVSTYTLRGEGKLQDAFQITLPEAGNYPLDTPLPICTIQGQVVKMYLGSESEWKTHTDAP